MLAEAEEAYRCALKLRPDYALAIGNLAAVLLEAGQVRGASRG
jgi:Flp pilus assembly protein TadD